MLKQVFRLTFLALIWKQYKRGIVSTCLLIIFFWLVNFAHAEYLSFAQFQTGDVNIGFSFFIKWFCLIAGGIVYVVYHFWKPKESTNAFRGSQNQSETSESSDHDPFESIRHKETLRTRAEMMLEENKTLSKNKK